MKAKLSRKNQVVIPSAIRRELELKGGDQILFVPNGKIALVMKAPKSFAGSLKGILAGFGESVCKRIDKERADW